MARKEQHNKGPREVSSIIHDPRVSDNAQTGCVDEWQRDLQTGHLDWKLADVLLPVFNNGDIVYLCDAVEVAIQNTADGPTGGKAAEAKGQIAEANMERVEAVAFLELIGEGA